MRSNEAPANRRLRLLLLVHVPDFVLGTLLALDDAARHVVALGVVLSDADELPSDRWYALVRELEAEQFDHGPAVDVVARAVQRWLARTRKQRHLPYPELHFQDARMPYGGAATASGITKWLDQFSTAVITSVGLQRHGDLTTCRIRLTSGRPYSHTFPAVIPWPDRTEMPATEVLLIAAMFFLTESSKITWLLHSLMEVGTPRDSVVEHIRNNVQTCWETAEDLMDLAERGQAGEDILPTLQKVRQSRNPDGAGSAPVHTAADARASSPVETRSQL